MVIDIHVHHSLEAGDPSPARRADALLARAERAGIDRLCLLGNVARFGQNPSPDEIRAINDTTMALVRRRGDRLTGMCFLNPRHGPGILLSEIDRCVAGGPLVGVKLWFQVNARDARLYPILRRAGELNVPVLHHAWYKTVGKYPGESDPSDIAHLARRHPGTTLIMAHLTGAGVRGVLDVRDCPNVLVDTSGSQPVAGLIEYAVEKLGAERVVFGSDACVRDFPCQIGKVLGARLRARDRELILGGNAARVLGQAGETQA